jgi:pyruvate/2-oxoglutarate dehydrogenase complex dihydrolipoamide dehydrogenase (E3) component
MVDQLRKKRNTVDVAVIRFGFQYVSLTFLKQRRERESFTKSVIERNTDNAVGITCLHQQ